MLTEAASVNVVAYDHRGSGESSPATATLEQLGDDLAEVLERAVPHGPVVLVGHGMGGHVAMRMGRSASGACRAARAWVHGSLHRHRVGGGDAASPAWADRAGLQVILGPRLVGQVHRKVDKATTIGLRWLLLGDDPSPEDVRLVAEMVARHWPDTVALFRAALDRGDRAVALEMAAGLPVVAMVGEKDRLVPVGHAGPGVECAPDWYALSVPGAGRVLPLEAAAEIVPRILAEVREVLTR